MGLGNSVVPGQAAFSYSLMSPSHREGPRIVSFAGGGGDGLPEEFAADRSDPAFGERVGDRSPDGRFDDPEALGAEDFVERFDELAAAVADQRPSTV